MNSSVRPTDEQMRKMVDTYSNMLFKICFVMLCNEHDAEDAVQETFIKYLERNPRFESDEHEKAWLIRVAQNICNNMIRFRMRHKAVSLDDLREYCQDSSDLEALEFIMNIPAKYKSVLLLFYVERYQTNEIAQMLHLSETAVRKRLQYGRDLLKREYADDFENKQ